MIRDGMVLPRYAAVNGLAVELAPLSGAAVAVTVAFLYGLPTHAIVAFCVLTLATGFGISVGLHRLFCTIRSPPSRRSSGL